MLEDLGAGGAGIGGTDLDAGFIGAAGDGLVPGIQNLVHTLDFLSHDCRILPFIILLRLLKCVNHFLIIGI
jgi:hypothetical protein